MAPKRGLATHQAAEPISIVLVSAQGLSTGITRATLVACFLGCLAAGLGAATGRANIALGLITTSVVGAAVILERRRLAPFLWAGVAFTAPLQGVRVAPSITLSDVLIVIALLTILPNARHDSRRVIPAGAILAFSLLIIAGLIGTFSAAEVGTSLANLIKFVFAAAGSVAAMTLWSARTLYLRPFAWIWFAGATFSAAFAVANPRAFAGRALGLANHPNHFGLVCVLGVGLGLGLALSSTGRAQVAALTGVMLLFAGIGLSGSRAAILGVVVTIGLTAVLARRFRLLVATGVVMVLLAMATIVGIFQFSESNAFTRLGGGGGSGASDLERKQTLADALASIARYPFTGEGFGAQAAHNIYLQALVIGGPLALISFLYGSGLLLRAGFRGVRVHRGLPTGSLLAGLTGGYGGYLVSGVFNPILWDRYLWTHIGLLLVLAASRPRMPPVKVRGYAGTLEPHPGASPSNGSKNASPLLLRTDAFGPDG